MAVVLTDVGTAAMAAGDGKAATRHYKRALTFCPTFADAYYNLAVAYTARGKIEQAIMNYELAVRRPRPAAASRDTTALR